MRTTLGIPSPEEPPDGLQRYCGWFRSVGSANEGEVQMGSFLKLNALRCVSMQVSFRIDAGELGSGRAPIAGWSRDSGILACAGSSSPVLLYDRRGARIEAFPAVNPAILDWDNESRCLAVASSGWADISTFSLQQRKLSVVGAPFPPTWMAFSKTGGFLIAE
jgi:hypothetical protein